MWGIICLFCGIKCWIKSRFVKVVKCTCYPWNTYSHWSSVLSEKPVLGVSIWSIIATVDKKKRFLKAFVTCNYKFKEKLVVKSSWKYCHSNIIHVSLLFYWTELDPFYDWHWLFLRYYLCNKKDMNFRVIAFYLEVNHLQLHPFQ
jgi:hypothetical protein